EGEEDGAQLVERKRFRIADRPERGCMHARDGNEPDRSLWGYRFRGFGLEPRHVGDDDPGFLVEPQLERKGLAAEGWGERRLSEQLGDDDRDEAPLAPREAPDVFAQGLERAVFPGK